MPITQLSTHPAADYLDGVALGTLLLLWQDTITKASHRRKSLFGAHDFRGFESMTVMVGNMVAGRQANMILEKLRTYILIYNHEAVERDTRNGLSLSQLPQ